MGRPSGVPSRTLSRCRRHRRGRPGSRGVGAFRPHTIQVVIVSCAAPVLLSADNQSTIGNPVAPCFRTDTYRPRYVACVSTWRYPDNLDIGLSRLLSGCRTRWLRIYPIPCRHHRRRGYGACRSRRVGQQTESHSSACAVFDTIAPLWIRCVHAQFR